MRFAVTAGHGGNDPGAVTGGVCERDLMTELRDIVAVKLRGKGAEVRTDGERWRQRQLLINHPQPLRWLLSSLSHEPPTP